MKKLLTQLFFWLLMGHICCTPKPENPMLSVLNKVDFPDLPSGSGLALWSDSLYVLGDDAPYLYRISREYKLLGKQLLLPKYADSGRISKLLKPDLESLTPVIWNGSQALMAFGSGSKTPERDSLLVIHLASEQPPLSFSLTHFYDHLCREAGINREALNVEGALLLENQLWLLNRAQNSITLLSLEAFTQHLLGRISAEKVALQSYTLQLPQINQKQARFSGACAIPNTRQILFTATVEDTDNWIDDGEILGSFVGILAIDQLKTGQAQHAWLLKNSSGETLKEKLESIELLQRDGGSLKIITVADNDDGSSRMFELQLNNLQDILEPNAQP